MATTSLICLALVLAPLRAGDQTASQPAGLEQRPLAKENGKRPAGKRKNTWTHVVTLDTVYYTGGPQQGRPPDGTLKAGTKVVVLNARTGSYVLVRSETGVVAFVAAGSLKKLARRAAGVPQQPKDKGPMDEQRQQYVRVEVCGVLHTGVMAIGGETTGVTISANGIVWELELQGKDQWRKLAAQLNGKRVRVTGTLELRRGVERGQRWIVHVRQLAAAP